MALDHTSKQLYPNDYVGAERCFVPEQDWREGRFLEMWVKNDEHPKFLVLQIGEGSRCAGEAFKGEVWQTSIRLSPGQQGTVNLPLDDSLFFSRTDWSPQQNSQLDLDKIGYLAVGVRRAEGNSGTVELGTVRLWQ